MGPEWISGTWGYGWWWAVKGMRMWRGNCRIMRAFHGFVSGLSILIIRRGQQKRGIGWACHMSWQIPINGWSATFYTWPWIYKYLDVLSKIVRMVEVLLNIQKLANSQVRKFSYVGGTRLDLAFRNFNVLIAYFWAPKIPKDTHHPPSRWQ